MKQKLRVNNASCQIYKTLTNLKCLLISPVSYRKLLLKYCILAVETFHPHICCWKDSMLDNTD